MADLYRNPVGDPEIFSRYCRPLYIAVKLRDKVVSTGNTIIADFFIINEKNLKGTHTLKITLEHNSNVMSFKKTFNVKIKGGEEYGQLLVENVEIKLADFQGYYVVKAELTDRRGNLKAEGSDKVFAVDISDVKISKNGVLVDTSGIINRFLKNTWNFTLPEFTSKLPDPDYIIVGQGDFSIDDIMDRVANGVTAIVIDNADKFAGLISEGFYEAVDYRGRFRMKEAAFGGNFIAGKHELLDGLPQAQAFNWEYQVFYYYPDQDLYALKLSGVKPVVAAVSDHKKEVGTALSIVPFGRGQIILSTLSIVPWLETDTPQSVVAKRLFRNYLKYADSVNIKKK